MATLTFTEDAPYIYPMKNDDIYTDLRNRIEEKTKSVTPYLIIIAIFVAMACLSFSLSERTFFSNIKYLGDLMQALLVGSTAILAFSALMLVEIKKTNREELHSDNPLVRIYAENKITSEAMAVKILRWSSTASIVSMLASILFLMFNNPIATIVSLFTFSAQIYYFVLALTLSSFWQFIL